MIDHNFGDKEGRIDLKGFYKLELGQTVLIVLFVLKHGL